MKISRSAGATALLLGVLFSCVGCSSLQRTSSPMVLSPSTGATADPGVNPAPNGLRGIRLGHVNPFGHCVNDSIAIGQSGLTEPIRQPIRSVHICAPATPPGASRQYIAIPEAANSALLKALAAADPALPKVRGGFISCPIEGPDFGYEVVAIDVTAQWWLVHVPSGICDIPTPRATKALTLAIALAPGSD